MPPSPPPGVCLRLESPEQCPDRPSIDFSARPPRCLRWRLGRLSDYAATRRLSPTLPPSPPPELVVGGPARKALAGLSCWRTLLSWRPLHRRSLGDVPESRGIRAAVFRSGGRGRGSASPRREAWMCGGCATRQHGPGLGLEHGRGGGGVGTTAAAALLWLRRGHNTAVVRAAWWQGFPATVAAACGRQDVWMVVPAAAWAVAAWVHISFAGKTVDSSCRWLGCGVGEVAGLGMLRSILGWSVLVRMTVVLDDRHYIRLCCFGSTCLLQQHQLVHGGSLQS